MTPRPVRYVPSEHPSQPYSGPHEKPPRRQRARARRPYILTASSACLQDGNGMRDQGIGVLSSLFPAPAAPYIFTASSAYLQNRNVGLEPPSL